MASAGDEATRRVEEPASDAEKLLRKLKAFLASEKTKKFTSKQR